MLATSNVSLMLKGNLLPHVTEIGLATGKAGSRTRQDVENLPPTPISSLGVLLWAMSSCRLTSCLLRNLGGRTIPVFPEVPAEVSELGFIGSD